MRANGDVLRSVKRHVAASLKPLSDAQGDEWEVRTSNEPGTIHFPYARVFRTTPVAITGRARTRERTMGLNVSCYAGPRDTVDMADYIATEVEEMLVECFGGTGGTTLPAPAQPMGATDTVAGALAPGTYRYVVTAITRAGETVAGPPREVTLASTGSVILALGYMGSAKGYRVYRGAAGSEELMWQGAGLQVVDYGRQTNPNTSPPQTNGALVGMPWRVPLYDYSGIGLLEPADDFTSRLAPMDFAEVIDFTSQQIAEPEEETHVAVIASMRMRWRQDGVDFSGGRNGHNLVVEGRLEAS